MSENSENKKSNKKWVIKAAVIFVVALALLTFFSNTIMNATIPKVVAESTQRGNLSYSNNATGTIVADNKTKVDGVDGRVVEEVKVTNYDMVNEGDVILTLKTVEDQSELETLQTQLTTLQREAEYEARKPSEDNGLSSMQEAINTAQLAVNEAQDTLNQANNKDAVIAAAQSVINNNQSAVVEYQAQVDSASETLENLNAQISQLNSQLNTINESISVLAALGTPTPTPSTAPIDPSTIVPGSMEDLVNQKSDIEAQIAQLQSQVGDAQSRLDSASASLASVQATISDAESQIETANELPSVASAQNSLTSAQNALQQARQAYSDAQINAGISADQAQDAINDRNDQIEELEDKIEKLEDSINTVEIVAPASGYVMNLSAAAGDTLTTAAVAEIIPENADCSVEFKFSATVAQNMYTGMELTTSEYWIDSCVITSIKIDSSNPRDSRIVKCHLEGASIWPGETITVVADRANSNYDAIISSSAINEDNAGSFVYVIQQSTSALGDKYTVHRVSVSVEATDGSRSAISGDGIEGAQIVTRSDEPLNDGDRVRLQDYSSEEGNS